MRRFTYLFIAFALVFCFDSQANESKDDDATVAESKATAEKLNWLNDMETAKKQAVTEGKAILMDFTGSDWCAWCIKLSEEIFQQKEFQDWARTHVVLVELDFPSDEEKLSEEIRKHNDAWLKKFQVQGFPTVYLTDAEGRPFAMTGYKDGGPEAYVKHLQQLLQVRMLRDTAFGLATDAEGEDKARFLDDALATMDARIAGMHYESEIEIIKELGSDQLKQRYEELLAGAQGGAESAGIAREDWMSDPFGFLAMDMSDASEDLGQVVTEPPVTTYHPRIESRLAKLIELMNKT